MYCGGADLVAAVIVVVLFAILYELLKTIRELLMYFDLKRINKNMRVLRKSSFINSSTENIMAEDTTTQCVHKPRVNYTC